MKKYKIHIIQFIAISLYLILPTVILWYQYAISGNNIIKLNGIITSIDTTSLEDCDIVEKSRYKIVFHYSYSYNNVSYSNNYETCETNDGLKTVLQIYPINSTIALYLKKDDATISDVNYTALMNQYFLGFAIAFTFIAVIAILSFTCCFETVTKKMEKLLIDKAINAADNALGSVM
jgi:energy-coupling factor transporter transmembrane protein EcfT